MASLVCLCCGKSVTVPGRLIEMAETYQGKPVAFCSRSCNTRWIADEGRKGQEKQMRDLLERLGEDLK